MTRNLVAQKERSSSLLVRMGERFGVDPDKMMSTLKSTAFKGDVTTEQMMALLIVAEQFGLNPWTREIYAFPDRHNGIVPVIGVDGWARIINEHKDFDGMSFEQDDESCTCTIYRKDRTHPSVVTEYFSECRRDTQPWKSHPKRMLRHKAMIQCARLAFGFVGAYDPDEAERIIDVTPKKSTTLSDLTNTRELSGESADTETGEVLEFDLDAACKRLEGRRTIAALDREYDAVIDELRKAHAGAELPMEVVTVTSADERERGYRLQVLGAKYQEIRSSLEDRGRL